MNASVDCTEGSFIQIGSLGNVSAPNHTVGAPPEPRWPDGADEVTARCFRMYPAGVGNGTDHVKSVGVPRGVSHGVPEPIAGDVRVRERRVYLGRGGDAEGRGRAGESGTQGEVRQGRDAC